MAADYCEMCDLPLSTCVHGMPPPPPEPPKPAAAPRTRAPRASTSSAATRSPAPPTRRAPRRFTSPEVIAPHIVAVLEEAGGELEADDFFARLEEHLGETLLEGDRQTTPEGELRWRYATRRARQTLIAEGRLGRGSSGTWTLP